MDGFVGVELVRLVGGTPMSIAREGKDIEGSSISVCKKEVYVVRLILG